jgi:hypothetical protein
MLMLACKTRDSSSGLLLVVPPVVVHLGAHGAFADEQLVHQLLQPLAHGPREEPRDAVDLPPEVVLLSWPLPAVEPQPRGLHHLHRAALSAVVPDPDDQPLVALQHRPRARVQRVPVQQRVRHRPPVLVVLEPRRVHPLTRAVLGEVGPDERAPRRSCSRVA